MTPFKLIPGFTFRFVGECPAGTPRCASEHGNCDVAETIVIELSRKAVAKRPELAGTPWRYVLAYGPADSLSSQRTRVLF